MKFGPIPWELIAALLPAFLAELFFYVLPAIPRLRRFVDRLPAALQSLLFFVSALLPYLLLNLPNGLPAREELAFLAAVSAVICCWFLLLPKRSFFDLLLLALLALLLLNKTWWAPFYPSPPGAPNVSILGQSLWYRLGICVFLFHRRWQGTDFGFWPRGREWIIGLQQFVLLSAVLFPLLWSYGTVHLQLPRIAPVLIVPFAVLTFFAVLWVLAVWEEFFFRGVLLQLLSRELGNRWAGLALSSLLFGAVHLPYRQFPNWRFALAAMIAGVFYGLAFERAQSIRAAMVTHALVVTFWTVLFGRSI